MFLYSEDAITDELHWLKYNCQPWTEVLRKWQVTSAYRVNMFLEGERDVESFKLLLNPKVDSLVCLYCSCIVLSFTKLLSADIRFILLLSVVQSVVMQLIE
jgi:hypothetical protein